ncbi:MAG TPA: arylesterase [Gammaproteobacteria bacterium]|nr:arylesterase [Gammaproteobacteria bacterium]
MYRILLLLVFLAAPAAKAAPPVILIVGDSLSAGYGLAIHENWPSLLQDRLEEAGYPHRVVNASISGDTTSGGLARLPRALERNSPEVVIIGLGGNDGLRAIPIPEIRRNLARMIQISRAEGAEVLLAGVHIPPNYGPAYTEAFHGVYHELAQEYGAGLVPFILEGVALNAALMQEDGLHPTAEAQPLIVDNVWPELVSMLESAHPDSNQ